MQHTGKRAGLLKSALLGAATLGALSLAGAGVAQATTLSLGYSLDGGTTINFIASDSGSGSVSPGTAGLPSLADFTISSFSAAAFPPGGASIDSNTIDLTTKNTATNSPPKAGGNLFLYVTNQSLSAGLSGYNLLSSYTSNLINSATTGNSATLSTYVDSNNGRFTTSGSGVTQLGTSGPLTVSDTTAKITNPIPTVTSAFSETLVYDITMVSNADVNLTIDTRASAAAKVPEPGSLALLGTGLLGLGLVARRRRRKA